MSIKAKYETKFVGNSELIISHLLHYRCVSGKVHDRMPVILHREDEENWLDKEADSKELMHLLRPYDGDLMSWKVSKAVGNVRNDGPELIKPIK